MAAPVFSWTYGPGAASPILKAEVGIVRALHPATWSTSEWVGLLLFSVWTGVILGIMTGSLVFKRRR